MSRQTRQMPRPRVEPKLQAIAGKVPVHDLGAELAVLSACILKNEEIDNVVRALRAPDFYSIANGLIFETIIELRAGGQPVDSVMIADVLRARGKLEQVGGAAYIAQMPDATPAVTNVMAHADIVARLARQRRIVAEAQRIVSTGYDPAPEEWGTNSARAIQDVAEARIHRGVIASNWAPLSIHYLLEDAPPQPWLLQHPTVDGEPCPPGQGDGLFPMGEAGMLSSEGGAGKTMALMQLGMCVALGIPWLDHFEIGEEARGGRVLLLLAEEKPHHIHRRMRACAKTMKLTREQAERVTERVVAIGLSGQPVTLVGPSADGTGIDVTDEHRDLQKLLARVQFRRCPKCRVVTGRPECECGQELPPILGWSLVVLDPLARWAGADTETDNIGATRFVQAVETLSQAPGNPGVLVAHHSSKVARREGKADSRGATGLTDGFRWQGTLRNVKKGAKFQQVKSNYSAPMVDELDLVRLKGGVLRVKSEDEIREEEAKVEDRFAEREHRRVEANEDRIQAAARAILDTLTKCNRAQTVIKSRSQLLALVKGGQQPKNDALSRLLHEGRIIPDKTMGYLVAPPKSDPGEHTPNEHHQGALFGASP